MSTTVNATMGQAPVLSFPVVGVGASAGGLDAFTQLLRALPPRPGIALLFVQHLDPTHPTLLAEILARETRLPVAIATEGTPVEADHVYVIPPDTLLSVSEGTLRLLPRGRGPHFPVDHLFRSLAELGPRAIAVVLSGGGTDGTLGLADVRGAGGATLAQDEASSGQTGMPASAAASGNVDVVLPPAGIAEALVRLAAHPGAFHAAPDEGDAEATEAMEAATAPAKQDAAALAPLFALLGKATGVDFAAYKQNTLRRRVHRRLVLRGMSSVTELVDAARRDPAELDAISRDLLIGVTQFFRDPEVFEGLAEKGLPPLLEAHPPETGIRVWVPGCSTGEEAYSLAIVFTEFLEKAAHGTAVKILATDVNEPSLVKARAGLYPESIAADVSPERLRRFFRKSESGYRVTAEIRDLCVFARHDVTRDPPFARMDLVSCRNVLIYFGSALQRRIIPAFHYALRPGGRLLLGPAESVGTFTDLFTATPGEPRLYIRTLAPSRVPAVVGPARPLARAVLAPVPVAAEPGGLPEVQREADRLLLRYGPAAVIVDDQLVVLQFRGDTEAYLRHPPGLATLDVLRMAREGLVPDLRDLLAAARTGGVPVERTGVRVGEGSAARMITLRVLPLAGGGPGLRCFLVLFEEESPDAARHRLAPAPAAQESPEDPQGKLDLLRRELDANRDHQQALAEEYEATNEELKSASEEILASNEELQSTNEELQTAKEEMQSTNEELETVNQELVHRNRETARANDDLRSLLVGVNVPVVVLSRDLRIRQITAQAETVLGLRASDTGRPIRDFRLLLDVPNLAALAGGVIDTLTPAAVETRDAEGRWYVVRLRAYETADNRIDGVVLTAIDVDGLKKSEEALRASRDFSAAVLDTVQVALVVLDPDSGVLTANRSFERAFGTAAPGERPGSLFELGQREWDVPEVRELLERAQSTGAAEEVELVLATPLGARTLRINLRPLAAAAGKETRGTPGRDLLLAIEDVTDARRGEEERRQIETRMFHAQKLESLGVMAGGIAHDLNNILTPVIAYTGLAREALPAGSPVAEFLSEVDVSARRAADLVSQILAYSGKSQREVRRLELNDLVRRYAPLLSRTLGTRAALGLVLGEEPLFVEGDAAQLSQVLINLVRNALEAIPETESRGGSVKVRTFAIEADQAMLQPAFQDGDNLCEGLYAVLEVSDSGTGMTRETQDRLFDPFFTTKFTGRGLGLAAVRGIVRAHAGCVTVSSEPGKGSTFRVLLPLAEGSGLAGTSTGAESPADVVSAGSRATRRVLVVDDEKPVRALLRHILKGEGLEVLEAEDGAKAVETLEANLGSIDAVLLDLTMPRMNGPEALAALRALDPAIPILLMSGYGVEQAQTLLAGRESVGFLHKPFKPREVLAAVHALLGN